MQNITLGEIGTFLGFLVALVGSVLTILKYAKNGLKLALKDEFKPIKEDLINLDKKITQNTLNQDKNFLIRCFDDLEKGATLSETTKERIFESMKSYDENGGNGYIKHRFDAIVKAGLL